MTTLRGGFVWTLVACLLVGGCGDDDADDGGAVVDAGAEADAAADADAGAGADAGADAGTEPVAMCGNGDLEPGEACDRGAANGETACPYGVSSCTTCDATCTAEMTLVGNVCGDGNRDPVAEECDDSNTITESACPYGQAFCTVCSSTCTDIAETGGQCGDGFADLPDETCDDNNNSTCGSCSPDCQTIQLDRATGLIAAIPGSQIDDGETFAISDGLSPEVVFEFNPSGGSNVPVAILAADDASTVAQKIRLAIDDEAIAIDAVANGPLVRLTHQLPTSLGNLAITSTVANVDFYVEGMSGGAGGDCPPGTTCASAGDCASGSCGSSQPGSCD